MNSSFFAMLGRMKHIARWGLMHSTRQENLSEHTLEVAYLAHGLAVLGVLTASWSRGRRCSTPSTTIAAKY